MRRLNLLCCLIVSLVCILNTPSVADMQMIDMDSMRDFLDSECINYCPKTEYEFSKEVEEHLYQLLGAGLNPKFIESVKFRTYPNYQIKYEADKENHFVTGYTGYARYAGYTKNIEPEIIVVITVNSSVGTLYHELGHVVEFMELNTFGCDWENANEIGQEYTNLKNYTMPLDEETQSNLAWEDRICEWFAEDVRQVIYEEFAMAELESSYLSWYEGVGPPKTEEVHKLIRDLVFIQAPTESKTI